LCTGHGAARQTDAAFVTCSSLRKTSPASHAHQHELGERFGAEAAAGMYDVVIEATRSESSMDRSIALARPRGVISYVGVYEESFL
jgi:threonine dehydrogenase-like Zn-dependent dehydrogenase